MSTYLLICRIKLAEEQQLVIKMVYCRVGHFGLLRVLPPCLFFLCNGTYAFFNPPRHKNQRMLLKLKKGVACVCESV